MEQVLLWMLTQETALRQQVLWTLEGMLQREEAQNQPQKTVHQQLEQVLQALPIVRVEGVPVNFHPVSQQAAQSSERGGPPWSR